jgi:hypothetical protein
VAKASDKQTQSLQIWPKSDSGTCSLLASDNENPVIPVYDGNKLMEANCKHCHRVFADTREVGTGQCNRHLLVCEERAKINETP